MTKAESYQKAIEAFQSENFEESLNQFKLVVEEDFDNYSSWFHIGYLKESKDIEQAIQAYTHVITIDPTNSDAWYNLGKLFLISNNPTEAEKSFNSGLEANPKSNENLFAKGLLKFMNNEFEEAKDLFSNLLGTVSHAALHYNLGRCYYELKNYSKAIKEFQSSLDLAPNFLNSLYALASTHHVLHQDESSFEVFQKLVELIPEDWEFKEIVYEVLSELKENS